jgi:hypothetical protein
MHTTLSTLSVLAQEPQLLAANSLEQVITGIQGWIMGILAALATMFMIIGGLRYMAAGGDPAQIEQAKGNFKSAAFGYALAVLAPVLLGILAGIVGGPQ